MTAIPEDIKDAPPSDPLVWLVLADDGPLCVGDIGEATGELQQLETTG